MERLRFTYSLDINGQLIENHEIHEKFFISYGQIIVYWYLCIQNECADEKFRYYKSTDFLVFPESYEYKLPAKSHECSCKFILKRKNCPDLEQSAIAEDESDGPTFHLPKKNNEMSKFFKRFFAAPGETEAVLLIIMEFPKNAFFAKNWPTEVQMAPVGWENDTRYKVLTAEDKHDFHIICTDGVFYTKKRYLIKNCDFFKKRFESVWKNVSEIKLDISLETMKVIGTYLATKTFLGPKELKYKTFTEIWKTITRFDLTLHETHSKFMCQRFSEESFSFYELCSWWEVAGGVLKDIIIPTLVKNYYSDIITRYKPDATFTDKDKKKIHEVLHKDRISSCLEDEKTLFRLIVRFYKISQKVVISELKHNK